jgi:hypothetical protein
MTPNSGTAGAAFEGLFRGFRLALLVDYRFRESGKRLIRGLFLVEGFL